MKEGKLKRRINWFRVFILLAPFIALVVILYIMLVPKEESVQFAYLNNVKLPEATEKINIEGFTNGILDKLETVKIEEENSSVLYLGTFLCTAYDDCYECQEEFVGTTALGIPPTVNHTIAVDPSVIPLGTHVIINGVEYVAEDVGGIVNYNHIDIFVGSHEETYSDLYNGYFEIYEVR